MPARRQVLQRTREWRRREAFGMLSKSCQHLDGKLPGPLTTMSVRRREMGVNQQQGSPASESRDSSSGSAFGRIVGFVGRHPARLLHFAIFSLLAIIILQNVEPTSVDVLFWSIDAVPKLLLIFLSMLVGAVAWEILRRWLRH